MRGTKSLRRGAWTGGAGRSLAVAGALLALALPGRAQTCDYDFHQDYEQLTRLTDEFNPSRGDGDSKTELIAEGFSNATDQRHETWYVARNNCTGATGCCLGSGELDRTYNSSLLDYRDAPVANDQPGYTLDRVLGCPWTARTRQGLTPISRYLNSGINDYKTWLFGSAPTGYTTNATWWTTSPTPRLGYQRFANLLGRDDVLANAYDAAHTLDNGYLKVEYNRIWGDGIGRITHESTGRQVVWEPIGDMVQTVLRFADLGPPNASCKPRNPTQSGGLDCNLTGTSNESHTERWAGSPVLSEAVSGTDPKTFTSVVRPLDFCHNGVKLKGDGTDYSPWLGGVDDYDPLAWQGTFERADTLSCKLGATTRKDVVKTSSSFELGEGYAGPTPRTMIETNTAWLQEAWVADATHRPTFEVVDLSTGAVTAVSPGYTTPQDGSAVGKSLALVVSSADGSFAYAVVMKNLTAAGDYLDVTEHCGATCNPADTAIVLRANRNAGSVTTGSWGAPLESFLVVNNRASILTRLSEIYADSGDCLN